MGGVWQSPNFVAPLVTRTASLPVLPLADRTGATGFGRARERQGAQRPLRYVGICGGRARAHLDGARHDELQVDVAAA